MINEETELMKRIRAAASVPGFRLFRNNVGTGWTANPKDTKIYPKNYVELTNARPLRAGLEVGSSDLIGWREVIITPEMVGRKIAQFVSWEVKTGTGGNGSGPQRAWLKVVHYAGGFSGIIRTPEDAAALAALPPRLADVKPE